MTVGLVQEGLTRQKLVCGSGSAPKLLFSQMQTDCIDICMPCHANAWGSLGDALAWGFSRQSVGRGRPTIQIGMPACVLIPTRHIFLLLLDNAPPPLPSDLGAEWGSI